MKIIFLNLLLTVGISSSVSAQTNQIADLAPGTEIDILLDQPAFYSTGKIRWESQNMKCTISSNTYYDKNLVANLKTIRYFTKTSYFQDVVGKYNNSIQSQWSTQLDHENKALPQLGMDCLTKTLFDFSISNVEKLTNGEIVFANKKFRRTIFNPMNKLMPLYPKKVLVKKELSFGFKSISQNSGSPSEIYVIDGKIVTLPFQANSSRCRLSYSWLSMSKDQQITLAPETVLDQNWISQSMNSINAVNSYYIFTIQSTMAQGLNIECSHPTGFASFSEIQDHLTGIIEFQF